MKRYPLVMITFDLTKNVSKSSAPDFSARMRDDRNATSFDAMNAKERLANLEEAPAGAAERALVAGVLRQATADLRRFRGAQDAIGREMYLDARSWFNSNDSEWPYSFINICRALSLCPETVLHDVFVDSEASWGSHSRRVASRVVKSVKRSLSNAFAIRRSQTLALADS